MNKVIQSRHFTTERAWGALDITNMNGISVRLHWTDKPYKWHINEGDIFYAGIGTEHVAHPQGEARILVIEKEDSI